MVIGQSAPHEGRCDICKKKGTVITAGDSETRMAVSICRGCGAKMGNMMLDELIEKHGKKDDHPFKQAVRYEKGSFAG
jgi:hypothetical protein